jgi:hypothetical protein
MKFSKEKPSIWDRLEKRFNVKWGGSLVVAYKDTIYHSEPLPPDLIAHEAVHLARQQNPDEWWSRYLDDPKFRFGEELLAYREQYKFIKDTTKDRNEVARHLWRLASDLSGPTYDLPINHSECMRLIKMK